MRRILIIIGIFSLAAYGYIYRYRPSTRFLLQDPAVHSLSLQLEDLSRDNRTIVEIKAVAEERQQKMLTLAREDPQKFLANTLTEAQLAKLPEEIKNSPLVEQPIKASGELIVTHLENFETQETKLEYAIKKAGGDQNLYSLSSADKFNPQLGGATVSVSGTVIGAAIVIPSTGGDNFQVTALPLVNELTQEHRVLAIMFNFLNDKINPDTAPELRSKLFESGNSANAYYRDSSYSQISLSGDVVGPFTIPFQKIEGNCWDYNQWAIAADTLAYANGIDPNAYQHVVYSFPRPDNCWAGAWADIGGQRTRAYLPGNFNSDVIAHELGHNLGFYHANFWQCTVSGTTNQLNNYTDCQSTEYGDPYDTMGWIGRYNSINGPHRVQAGWLEPAQIQTATASGVYSLLPLEIAGPGIKVLKIPGSANNQDYYLEYRQPAGFDGDLSAYETSGVQLRAFSGYVTNLLDPNISLNDPGLRHSASDYNQSILQDGSTFVDSDSGLTIRQISHSSQAAVVEIAIDETRCQYQKPDISLSPGSASAPLNQDVSFRLTVTNRDSSECSRGVFNGSVWGDSIVVSNSYFSDIFLNPGESYNFDFTARFDDKATLGAHSIKGFVSSASHQNETAAEFSLDGQISSVQLSLGNITTTVASEPTHLSALAYDNYGRPLWNNLTYDWGMSSNNSVGTISPDVNIANFIPLRSGQGDLFVTAGRAGIQVTKSIAVTVLPAATPSPSPSVAPGIPGDANNDSRVDGLDYVVWLNHYNQILTGGPAVGDFNSNGKVDGVDYVVWLNNFGRS